MKSKELRKKFFDFFIKNGHEQVASSSLIPAQDPTLLFANAGMNQFKDYFLGKETRSYTRAVSIQKCVRAGGKHNDLDNVGFTKRHLTFFEMMGNFSFNDYFKKEAIQFAWDFLTKELNLPTHNLHVSVYETDDEAYDIWHDLMKVPKERIHRLGAAENFWQMGDTGPCGPCTEIHVDRGAQYGCADDKECGPACDCDRFLEIWNLVFMQYDRQPDGTDKPLKHRGVDTGMGLERLTAVVQNKGSVYETDVFTVLIARIEQLTGKKYAEQSDALKAAFHVLADHVRSSTMIIADGGAPSNEGRGYVLRKIIRRAALFAQKLSDKNIFPELSRTVIAEFADVYPNLKEQEKQIVSILESEIQKFAENLIRGTAILEKHFTEQQTTKRINGEQAFKLYDTFGFPIELINVMAHEKGYIVDMVGFENEMAQQKEQSGKKTSDPLAHIDLGDDVVTTFTGYESLETPSTIIGLIYEDLAVQEAPAGSECWIITKESPFFIVGGGQVPDQGWLTIEGHKKPILEVRYFNKGIGAKIEVPVDISLGDPVISTVDPVRRTNAMKNHTATHLLQSALIDIFGKQIKQSGSLVDPDYLRFDFTYHENLSPQQVHHVEHLVNRKIQENIPVNIEQTTLKNALSKGVIAFFGDKYNPEQVRIVEVPGFSAELCGGTHVNATGDIGVFKIIENTALSAGHRRIVAVTGPRAVDLFQETFDTVKNLSQEFKVKRDEVIHAVHKQQELLKDIQTQIKHLKKQSWQSQLPVWQKEVATVGSIPTLCLQLTGLGNDELRDIAAYLQTKQPGFYFLVSADGDRSSFICSLAPQFKDALNLKNFGAWLNEHHELRGGGNPASLQGGGGKIKPRLKDEILEWVKKNQ